MAEEKQEKLYEAARQGNIPLMKELLKQGSDPREGWVLMYAAEKGQTEAVEFLIPKSNPHFNFSSPLTSAAENGHLDCVRLLIPCSDPKAFDSAALVSAARNGHVECVKELIPVSDLAARGYAPLFAASSKGHLECVKLLMPAHNSPSRSSALRCVNAAASKGHVEVLNFLLDSFSADKEYQDVLNGAFVSSVMEKQAASVDFLLSKMDYKTWMERVSGKLTAQGVSFLENQVLSKKNPSTGSRHSPSGL